jgi:cytosine/adenosine deaminase-related metal-dependent hydrolase
VSQDYFAALSELSQRHDLPFNIHILETKLQRVLGEVKYGRSLVRYVHDLGLLDERMMVIHAIWLDERDIELLAAARCTVAHNPVCNLRLGSGVMPYYALRAAGVPICLGSDEMSTDDTANMWHVAKTAALLQTIARPEYRDWPAAPELLAALTRGGARALRRADRLGQLAPGCRADIVLLDLDTHAFTPLNDLRRQLVFCEDGASVRYTIVDGRVLYEDGRVTTLDEKALRAEARSLGSAARAAFARADDEARRLEPHYRQMYLKAAAREVGFTRWLE